MYKIGLGQIAAGAMLLICGAMLAHDGHPIVGWLALVIGIHTLWGSIHRDPPAPDNAVASIRI